MAHKVNPKSFRIKDIASWDSRGFYEKNFASTLEEDFRIREFLNKKIGKLGVEKVEIERSPAKINVIISTARPGLIIGRGGGGVEELKKELENKVLKKASVIVRGAKTSQINKPETAKSELKIEIREVRDPWASAPLIAQWIAGQIEKRVPYRRVLKQALDKAMAQKSVEGIRAEVAGRLDGVQISRREWLRKGRLPRQTLRADIDYAQERASCIYGIIGIKVWLYKGEKF